MKQTAMQGGIRYDTIQYYIKQYYIKSSHMINKPCSVNLDPVRSYNQPFFLVVSLNS